VDIEAESKDSHRLLGGMGDDMEGSSGLLGGSLARVTNMLGAGRTNRQVS
jgi:blocked-early-in-transport protein 1